MLIYTWNRRRYGYQEFSHRVTKKNFVTVKFNKILRETDKAYFVQAYQGRVWVAKRFCSINMEDKLITMPEWLAAKSGFIS